MPNLFSQNDPFVQPEVNHTMGTTHSSNNELHITNISNTLLQDAMPLLALIVALKNTQECKYIKELHQKIVEQIKYFEYRARRDNYPKRIILAARYCLATALDEAILKTQWGQNSIWTQQTLLNQLHNEANGGDRFYLILDNMLENANDNIHLLEMQYFILSLGFVGKYYNDEEKWDRIRDNLFKVIVQYKPTFTNFFEGKVHRIKIKNKRISLVIIVIFTFTALLANSLVIEWNSRKYERLIEDMTDTLLYKDNNNNIDSLR